MCALAEHLSQSEIELPLRNTCYYSPLAEVGVSTQTEMKNVGFSYITQKFFFKNGAEVKRLHGVVKKAELEEAVAEAAEK